MDHATPLVTARTLAKRLGLSVCWIRAETEAGRLPHLKAGRRVLYAEEAVKKSLIRRASEGADDE